MILLEEMATKEDVEERVSEAGDKHYHGERSDFQCVRYGKKEHEAAMQNSMGEDHKE